MSAVGEIEWSRGRAQLNWRSHDVIDGSNDCTVTAVGIALGPAPSLRSANSVDLALKSGSLLRGIFIGSGLVRQGPLLPGCNPASRTGTLLLIDKSACRFIPSQVETPQARSQAMGL